MMNILIVEDETAAYDNLCSILSEVAPHINIAGKTESVARTVEWLKSNPSPDLIFMDIHLSDDSSFAIFDKMEVDTPIIFTTAYDRYAIEAFKVNSIDYLLKPIKSKDVAQALEKFGKLTRNDMMQYLSRITALLPTTKYRDKILIPHKDKLLPVGVEEVSYFYTTDKNTLVYLRNGKCYPYPKTLESIMTMLNPAGFFRANKQFVVPRHSVTDITVWFDNRLLITLDTPTPEHIYISKNRAAEFKEWIVNQG